MGRLRLGLAASGGRPLSSESVGSDSPPASSSSSRPPSSLNSTGHTPSSRLILATSRVYSTDTTSPARPAPPPAGGSGVVTTKNPPRLIHRRLWKRAGSRTKPVVPSGRWIWGVGWWEGWRSTTARVVVGACAHLLLSSHLDLVGAHAQRSHDGLPAAWRRCIAGQGAAHGVLAAGRLLTSFHLRGSFSGCAEKKMIGTCF